MVKPLKILCRSCNTVFLVMAAPQQKHPINLIEHGYIATNFPLGEQGAFCPNCDELENLVVLENEK